MSTPLFLLAIQKLILNLKINILIIFISSHNYKLFIIIII